MEKFEIQNDQNFIRTGKKWDFAVISSSVPLPNQREANFCCFLYQAQHQTFNTQ